MSSVLATPIHEAGHLVAALLLRTDRPHRVSVELTETSLGHVWAGETESAKDRAQRVREMLRQESGNRSFLRERAEREIQVDFAGIVAEELAIGRTPRDGGGRQDVKNADLRLQPFITSRSERRARLRLLRRRVTKLLANAGAREALEYAEAELDAWGTLERDALDDLMGELTKIIEKLILPLPLPTKAQRARFEARLRAFAHHGASSSI